MPSGSRPRCALSSGDERDGFFYCRDHEEKSIRIKTIGGLLGLMALEPGDPEVEPLVAHLRDESEFWTPLPRAVGRH